MRIGRAARRRADARADDDEGARAERDAAQERGREKNADHVGFHRAVMLPAPDPAAHPDPVVCKQMLAPAGTLVVAKVKLWLVAAVPLAFMLVDPPRLVPDPHVVPLGADHTVTVAAAPTAVSIRAVMEVSVTA